MQTLWQDLRFGACILRKRPGFTLTAVITLALGIGANTAIFSMVNGVLLRPLPYADPDELVVIQNQFLARNLKDAGVSPADYADYRRQTHVFEEVAVVSQTNMNLTGVDPPETLSGASVTAGLFRVLGTRAVAGRLFTEEEDQPGRNQVVVISAALWNRRFGGDSDVLGRHIQLNDQSYAVIGVVPPILEFLAGIDVFTPAAFTAQQLNPTVRGSRFLALAIARLRTGISLEQARAEMNALSAGLAKQFPNQYPEESGWSIRVDSLRQLWVGDVRLALLVLLGAVGFVLFIACANVANLLLARASMRANEISIRIALGAMRRRIARRLLTENALLALIGGASGLLLAAWGLDLMVKAGPQVFPRVREIGLDVYVLGFTLATSLVTALLVGLAPILQFADLKAHQPFKERSQAATGSLPFQRTSSVLVCR